MVMRGVVLQPKESDGAKCYVTGKDWIVEAATSQNSAQCPGCGVVSSRHSRYQRQIRDLPFQGARVMLKLHLVRWRCRTPECRYQIFSERLPSVVAPHGGSSSSRAEIYSKDLALGRLAVRNRTKA